MLIHSKLKEKNPVSMFGKLIANEISSLSVDKSLSQDMISNAFISAIQSAFSDESGINVVAKFVDSQLVLYAKLLPGNVKNNFYHFKNDSLNLSEKQEAHLEYLVSYDFSTLSGLSRFVINKLSKYFREEIKILEKQRELEIFESKKNQIVNGNVTAFDNGNCIINLGLGEGILMKTDMIQNDFINVGDNIKAYVKDVKFNPEGYQITLSRTAPEFLVGIMESLIPEIENRSINVLKAVRNPGLRSKVAVYSESQMINPASCCIGKDGVRIKAVRSEIGNEIVDIVPWNEDPAIFIANALRPIEIKKIVFDDNNRVDVVISDEDYNRARAYRHQQARLASRLTGFMITLIPETESDLQAQESMKVLLNDLIEIGLSELEARILMNHGINSIEEFIEMPKEEIMNVISDNYDDQQIDALLYKAHSLVNQRIDQVYDDLGISQELSKMPYADLIPLEVLSKNAILTKKDLGEYDAIELSEVVGDYISNSSQEIIDMCSEMILWARHRG